MGGIFPLSTLWVLIEKALPLEGVIFCQLRMLCAIWWKNLVGEGMFFLRGLGNALSRGARLSGQRRAKDEGLRLNRMGHDDLLVYFLSAMHCFHERDTWEAVANSSFVK